MIHLIIYVSPENQLIKATVEARALPGIHIFETFHNLERAERYASVISARYETGLVRQYSKEQ